MSKRFVVITTDHTRRGVFAGYLVEQEGGCIVLEQAQNCIYWSGQTRGVLGLAAIGPQNGSRIGPPVSRLELDGVTAVMDTTKEAREKWQAQPWS